MPASGAALFIALAMVPGYLYLQLTRRVRQPFAKSAVGEVLEILGVGLGTTGLAFVVVLVFAPGTALAVLGTFRKAPDTLTAGDLTLADGVSLRILPRGRLMNRVRRPIWANGNKGIDMSYAKVDDSAWGVTAKPGASSSVQVKEDSCA